MADEGASSSSNSVDDVETGPELKPATYSPSFASSCASANDSSCTTVSSSGQMTPCSQGIIELSRMSSNPFAIKSSTPTRSVADSTDNKGPAIVLRPSALAVQAEKIKLMNKFDTSPKQEGKENLSNESNIVIDSAKEEKPLIIESNGKVSKSELFACGISTSSDITVSSSSKASSETSNPFSLASTKPDELSANGGFVFGQNLHERVVNYDSNPDPASPTDAHNLTFEEAALKKEDLEEMEQRNQEEKVKTLSESAMEYESRQVKRKFDEVTVITGEEEESNVLQINCKLFAFDKVNMNWQERGRGILRLNDQEQNGVLHSRVVMRIQGSLRVVLNTKVWAGMSVEHPSQKSVRLTAFDPQGVKVFLVMAQPKDAEQLFNALDWRVTALRAANPRRQEGACSKFEEATSSSTPPDASELPPCKQIHLSDDFGADSSSETNFTSQSASTEGGCADSTNAQS